jgi:hypothetical protein
LAVLADQAGCHASGGAEKVAVLYLQAVEGDSFQSLSGE